jgi:hypothetical protein
VWDEFPSNHRERFEAVYSAMEGFKGKVVVCARDFKQILPVVLNGTKYDILDACCFSSTLWDLFERKKLVENMRLKNTGMSDVERQQQTKYAEMLLAVGEKNVLSLLNYDCVF